ncbi:MAG TPA: hypothetical protein VGN91_23045 [Bosea sp. (in: a-proteobacteria)]|jgi:hypothetical protein|nr:hypothetical protein [Bosea sp. (in: a-proteobacteria)]
MPTADHSVASIKRLACDLQKWPSFLTAKALARAAKRATASAEELAPHFKRVHLAATDLLKPGTRPDPAYAELRQAVAILDSVVKVRRKARNRLQ